MYLRKTVYMIALVCVIVGMGRVAPVFAMTGDDFGSFSGWMGGVQGNGANSAPDPSEYPTLEDCGWSSLWGSCSSSSGNQAAQQSSILDDIKGGLFLVGGESYSQGLADRVEQDPNFVQRAVGALVGLVFSFAGSVFLIMMIYGGITWMFARGNAEAADKAKDLITHAIMGLGIVFGAFAITYTIVYIYFTVVTPVGVSVVP